MINSIHTSHGEAVKLFRSLATARKNSLRIHYHSMIEISLILRGNGIYRTKERQYSISAGDVFFFRPNEPHCITDIADGGMELLNLHIAPYYLYTNFQNALSSDYIRILSATYPIGSNKVGELLSSEQMEHVRGLMRAIRGEMEMPQSDYVLLVHNYISSILICLSRAHPDKGASGDRKNYRRVVSAIAFIDANFRTDISLEQIASHVGYSRCYFSSIFKECMGMSPWDYISIKRIEEALALIRTTDDSILDIATRCGFNNTVNFCKIFKKYTNLSPGAFRK